jgi:hypothetical protein
MWQPSSKKYSAEGSAWATPESVIGAPCDRPCSVHFEFVAGDLAHESKADVVVAELRVDVFVVA